MQKENVKMRKPNVTEVITQIEVTLDKLKTSFTEECKWSK